MNVLVIPACFLMCLNKQFQPADPQHVSMFLIILFQIGKKLRENTNLDLCHSLNDVGSHPFREHIYMYHGHTCMHSHMLTDLWPSESI